MTTANQQTLNIAGSIVALLVISLLWYITIALVTQKIPPENASNLGQVIGIVSMQVGIIIGWFFGSSSSNKAKDDTIAAQAATIATTAPVVSGGGATVSLAPGEQTTVKAEDEK